MKTVVYDVEGALSFFNNNPNFEQEILGFNFFDTTKLTSMNLHQENTAPVRLGLMAFQRLMRIYPDRNLAKSFLEQGIDSAAKLATIERSQFLAEHAPALGVNGDLASQLHATAQTRLTQVVQQFFNIQGSVMPHSRTGCFSALAHATDEVFSALPDYDTLFGNQDYAGISEYRSVYSPAAYLTDLLRILDQYIRQPEGEKQKFGLYARRPDLKRLLLDEQNTTTQVKLSDIANYVLENAFSSQQPPDDFSVYQLLQNSIWHPPVVVYKPLASALYPFSLPFNLPQTSIATCLRQYSTSRAGVYSAFTLNADSDVLAREKVGVSPEQAKVITTPTSVPADLDSRWGVQGISEQAVAGLDNASFFLTKAGLSADELNILLTHDLGAVELAAGVAATFFIARAASLPAGMYVAVLDEEKQRVLRNVGLPAGSSVSNPLTKDNLDPLHRFIRLARVLGWSFTELDWVLQSACNNKLDATALRTIALLQEWKARYCLPLDVLCAFWTDMKVTGMGNGPKPQDLFNRIYNPDSTIDDPKAYRPKNSYTPLFAIEPVAWEPRGTDEASKNRLSWLCGALDLNPAEVISLAAYISPLQGTAETWTIPLNLHLLSRFYGLTTMARTFGLSVADLVWLLSQACPADMASIADVATIEKKIQWLKAEGLSPAILRLLLDPALWGQLPQNVSSLQMRNFLTTFLAENAYPEDRASRIRALAKQLADFWGVPVWLIDAMSDFIAIRLKSSLLDYTVALAQRVEQSDFQDKEMYLFFNAFLRYTVLGVILRLTQIQAQKLFERLPQDLTEDLLRELLLARDLITGFNDRDERLLTYLLNPPATPDDAARQLSGVATWDADEIKVVCAALGGPTWVPATAENITRLKQCFDMQAALGLNLGMLLDIAAAVVSSDYDKNSEVAARLLLDLCPNNNEDQPSPAKQAIAQTLCAARQSALTAKALGTLGFGSSQNLYEYFLVDFDASPELETSLIENAIAAVQLYIHRVRMNLEPEAVVTNPQLLQTWWQWMQNYRVWEANRQVFLYPENYALPDVRRNGSELFSRLQGALQETDIHEDNVVAAFTEYMNGFAEAADLNPCGAYETTLPGTAEKLLYQVGVTKLQPYRHYYRTAKLLPTATSLNYGEAIWSPWQALGADIKTANVAPVFAFGRFFVFWAEITRKQQMTALTEGQTTPQDMQIKNETICEALLYYSFQDFQGQWISPQRFSETLVNPTLVESFSLTVRARTEESQQEVIFVSHPLFGIHADMDSMQHYRINKNLDCEKYLGPIPPDPTSLYALELQANPDLPNKTRLVLKGTTGYPGIPFLRCYPLFGNAVDSVSKWSAPKPPKHWGDDEKGLANRAAKVSLSDGFLVIHGSPDKDGCIKANPVTIGFWMKKTDNYIPAIFGPIEVAGQMLYILYASYNFPNSIWVGEWDSDADIYRFDTPFVIEGSWLFVLLTLTETTVKLFVNGAEIFPTKAPYPHYIRGKMQDKTTGTRVTFINGDESTTLPFGGYISKLVIAENLTPEMHAKLLNSQLEQLQIDCAVLANVPNGARLTPVVNAPDCYIFTANKAQYLTRVVYPTAGNSHSNDVKVAFYRINSSCAQELSQRLLAGGLEALLSLSTQSVSELSFSELDPISECIVLPQPPDTIDFYGPMGVYLWEVFFHAPRLLGSVLCAHQQFADAKKMLEYIFNPTFPEDPGDPTFYWRFKPLKAVKPADLEKSLKDPTALAAYANDPFDPHAIAQLRISAYQKTVVMDYIDNLLNWGDQLFRTYTREALNEARMLYVLAYDLLGKRPENLEPYRLPLAMDYLELQARGYTISSFLIQLENHPSAATTFTGGLPNTPSNYIPGVYYGIPENQQFIAIFDRVADRLFKLSHGLNLDGVPARLPLFAPPINPQDVVNALARGEGLDSGGLLPTNQPVYRFRSLLEKARTFTSQVIEFGSSLLTALEKKDQAQLETLRASQEEMVLSFSLSLKEEQINAAVHAKEALLANLANAQTRQATYAEWLQKEKLPEEISQIDAIDTAKDLTEKSRITQIISSSLHAIPQSGSPFALTYGGQELGAVSDAVGAYISSEAEIHNLSGSLAGLAAEWKRRTDEWNLQQKLAELDIQQFESQIQGADSQISTATREYSLLQTQINQARAVENFLSTRFTNQELYQWMTRRLAAAYFQAYQTALGLARQCQTAYAYELDKEAPFLKIDPWDNLRHGLTSGETLMAALMQMEKAYLDKNSRRFEIQRIISFKHDLDKQQVLDNLKTGPNFKASFDLIEADLFSRDFSHKNRKLKSVTLSFPALLGPYQNICAELAYTGGSTVQWDNPAVAGYLKGEKPLTPEARAGIRTLPAKCECVAISRGLNDSGLFEFSFEDERYLPFEGISLAGTTHWQLELTNKNDAGTLVTNLTDVILTLYYTAEK